MVTCGRLAGAVDVIAALPMCGYEHVIAGPPGWGRYCYGTPGRAPMKSLHPWRAAPRRHWSTNLHSRHAPEGAAGKEMGQTSNDVTRTLPTKPSPEAERTAGGSLIAVKKVLTACCWSLLSCARRCLTVLCQLTLDTGRCSAPQVRCPRGD